MEVLLCLLLAINAATSEIVDAEDDVKASMHRECNQLRAKYRKTKLQLDGKKCRLAQEWAAELARTGNFRHGRHDQIIARGYRSTGSAFRGWMNSSGHRAWILRSSNTSAGWGHAISKKGTHYWVGVFR